MLRIFETPESVSQAAADFILSVGKKAVGERGGFSLVLSGGSTPRQIFDLIALRAADFRELWAATKFFWGDERCVPPDHADSNYRMAREHLLEPLAIPDDRIHRMKGEDPDSDRAAAAYEKLFPPQPDLILLGMGEDGHTASLFPGTAAVGESQRIVVPGLAPVEPTRRLTITPPAIRSARNVLVVTTGEGKAPALARVFAAKGSLDETPARLVREATWFVDRDAAGQLKNPTIAPEGETP